MYTFQKKLLLDVVAVQPLAAQGNVNQKRQFAAHRGWNAIALVSGASPTMTKLFWETLRAPVRVPGTQGSRPSRLCFLLICQKKQSKTKIQPLKIDFFVSRAICPALIIALHCIRPVDVWPVVKMKAERPCSLQLAQGVPGLQRLPARPLRSVIPSATHSF